MSIELDIVNRTTTLVAKRNSGKSVLLRYLVDTSRDKFAKIFVISPTEKVNHFYSGLVDKSCIFDEWKEEWADDLIQKMTEVNSEKSQTERKNVLLILDDVMADTNFHQSPALKKLYMRGRHINIAVIATCQYLHNLPPVCRSNADFCIVGQMNRQSVQLLVEEYLAGDLSKDEFVALYHRATKDYGFLIINCTSVKDNSDRNQLYGIIKTPEEYV